MTCWRRLRDWAEAGVFDRLHQTLLAEPNAAGRIDWSRACVDASHGRAKGGAGTGPSPVDCGKYRILLRQRGIRPLISRRGTRDNNQPVRWVVEQTLALLRQFRRLADRWERRTDIHHGFLTLATSIVCWRRLRTPMR